MNLKLFGEYTLLNVSLHTCVCDPLKEHVVANSALYVVKVNGRDAPKWKFWAETEISGCAWSQTENAL